MANAGTELSLGQDLVREAKSVASHATYKALSGKNWQQQQFMGHCITYCIYTLHNNLQLTTYIYELRVQTPDSHTHVPKITNYIPIANPYPWPMRVPDVSFHS